MGTICVFIGGPKAGTVMEVENNAQVVEFAASPKPFRDFLNCNDIANHTMEIIRYHRQLINVDEHVATVFAHKGLNNLDAFNELLRGYVKLHEKKVKP